MYLEYQIKFATRIVLKKMYSVETDVSEGGVTKQIVNCRITLIKVTLHELQT